MGVLWTLCEIGPCTFRKLQTECESISPAALNTRLKELQAAGFVHRTDAGYAPTDLGLQLYAHLCPLGDFAKDWGKHLQAEA